MSGFRSAASAAIAATALVAFAVSAAPTFAAKNQHHYRHGHVAAGVAVYPYSDSGAYYEQNEAVFPNTEDHSTECINGYRWQRHNHDWFKTTAQDTMPLPCRVGEGY